MLHEHSFRAGGKRVYTVMKIDDRRDRNVALGEKVDSVMRKVDSGGSRGLAKKFYLYGL